MKTFKNYINENEEKEIDEATIKNLAELCSNRIKANGIWLEKADIFVQLKFMLEYGEFASKIADKLLKKYSTDDEEISPNDIRDIESGTNIKNIADKLIGGLKPPFLSVIPYFFC